MRAGSSVARPRIRRDRGNCRRSWWSGNRARDTKSNRASLQHNAQRSQLHTETEMAGTGLGLDREHNARSDRPRTGPTVDTGATQPGASRPNNATDRPMRGSLLAWSRNRPRLTNCLRLSTGYTGSRSSFQIRCAGSLAGHRQEAKLDGVCPMFRTVDSWCASSISRRPARAVSLRSGLRLSDSGVRVERHRKAQWQRSSCE